VARSSQAGPLASAFHANQLDMAEPGRTLVQRDYRPTLRGGSFASIPALVGAIETWTEHWSDDPKPFVWHKTAEEIIAKVRRERKTGENVLLKETPARAYGSGSGVSEILRRRSSLSASQTRPPWRAYLTWIRRSSCLPHSRHVWWQSAERTSGVLGLPVRGAVWRRTRASARVGSGR
jgi:hypothetical protein